MRTFLLIALLSSVALAGCLSDDGGPAGTDDMVNLRDSGLDLDLMAGPALWHDPQNFPHPDYNWPTLSSPAADAISWHRPIDANDINGTVTGISFISPTSGLTTGAGIALYGSIAVVPGYSGGLSAVVDIRDPSDPQVLSKFPAQPSPDPNNPDNFLGNSHRGATIIAYPDGRIVTAISTSRIIDVWDITDPTDPQPLPFLTPTQGSHKMGVVPGTPIVYNAASDGGGTPDGYLPGGGTSVTEIFDLSDPENPVHVMDWENGYACHHIYFWNSPDGSKQRGICAGIEVTQIIDTSDPLDPQVIVDVPVHHGLAGTPSASIPIVAFSHYAGLNADGTVLMVGDEMGGGGLPPGCLVSKDAPAVPVVGVDPSDAQVSTPVGAMWFYDVSDETKPLLAGWYSADNDPTIKDLDTSCTAHHGRLVPEEGRDLIAMSFYGAGVVLLDFTTPSQPVVVDQHATGSDTWETWYYNGYLFTGDLNHGMEVFTVDSPN